MVDTSYGYTFTVVTRNPKKAFVFCLYFKTQQEAEAYAEKEIRERGKYDVDYILIRKGTTSAEDPVIWDSRKDYEPREEVHWLDTLIKAQADHYGLTVEQHARLMRDVADYLQQHPEL